jgi:Protein of unknown function (DUF3375)
MHYDEIVQLQEQHAAWALLRSPHAALMLSFFGRVFVESNSGGRPAAELVSLLDDELYALNQRLGAYTFRRSAQFYLDEWAAPERGWLRKYYPPGTDEPHYDLTPPVEKALLWVQDLRARDVVGTESRLSTLFELLRQMVFGADDDPQRRLADLRSRRAKLDAEIARAERGEIDLLDPLQQRDRYYQFARSARELLADFRQVEDNFRALDRSLREQIAGWTGSKGELLDEIVTNRKSISESDQGRSLQALNDFLLSRQRQAELADLLGRLSRIESIASQDERLASVHFDWIEAGERTQNTVRLLSEQLRRFLDDQVWLDNRRIFELLRDIEAHALALRDQSNRRDMPGMEIDAASVEVRLPTERPLYSPQRQTMINSAGVELAEPAFDASVLYEQVHIDLDELSRTVRAGLLDHDQVALTHLVEGRPLQQGLAELVGYLSLSDPAYAVVFDESRREQVTWQAGEVRRGADIPAVSFVRPVDEGGRP